MKPYIVNDKNKKNNLFLKKIIKRLYKPELGSPTIKLDSITPSLKDFNFISEDSSVMINNKKIKTNITSEQISESLYGNIYGVKTKR